MPTQAPAPSSRSLIGVLAALVGILGAVMALNWRDDSENVEASQVPTTLPQPTITAPTPPLDSTSTSATSAPSSTPSNPLFVSTYESLDTYDERHSRFATLPVQGEGPPYISYDRARQRVVFEQVESSCAVELKSYDGSDVTDIPVSGSRPAFSPSGVQLAVARSVGPACPAASGEVAIFENDSESRSFTTPDGGIVTAFAWSDSESRLAIESTSPDGSRSTVFVLDSASGEVIAQATPPSNESTKTPAFMPNGDLLFVELVRGNEFAPAEQYFSVLRLSRTPTQQRRIGALDGSVTSVARCLDGRAYAVIDEEVFTVDVSTGQRSTTGVVGAFAVAC